MKVLEITHIEDCFDGSFIKELHLDEPVTEAFIYHLEPMGNLQYFPHFPRPFFKIDSDELVIKGISNNTTIRAIVFNKDKLEELIALIGAFRQTKSGKSGA